MLEAVSGPDVLPALLPLSSNEGRSIMAQWIDLRALRAQLKIADVLGHYRVQLRTKGDQASGFCPLPGHADQKSPSFSANLRKNCFHCFGCGAKGNAVDLEILLMGLDPADPRSARAAGLKLAERLGLNVKERLPADKKGIPRSSGFPSSQRLMEPKPDDEPAAKNVLVNPPLGFALHNLDPTHPYLSCRGFNAETIAHFGLGFCSKGMLKERIAIPLHNENGQLIGYAGRVVDDANITGENPRYLLPGRRERDGAVIEFRKSVVLYNAHRVQRPVDDLVIVEGFTAVWWLWQHGVHNAVALLGASASESQLALIVRLVADSGRVWLLPDGDASGQQLAHELLPRLALRRWCRWIQLLDGEQPTDLTAEDILALIRC
jgi:DNA primase